MSSIAQTVPQVLTADECKGYFELGTQHLVDHFTAISECKTIEELTKLLKKYHTRRLIELTSMEQLLRSRLVGFDVIVDQSTDKAVFAAQVKISKARIAEELDATLEQIEFVNEEAAEAQQITEEDLFNYKTTANIFLTARQKVLVDWNVLYDASPLTMIDDIDNETIAIPADGSDMGVWINTMLEKTLENE